MKLIMLIGVIVALALAVAVGSRMSQDAMAVVVGVVCGIGAAIPTSLLMIWLITRHRDEQHDEGAARSTSLAPTYHVETMNVLQLRGDDAPSALPMLYHGGRHAHYLADGNQWRNTARRS
jgi:hypothetical protein